MNKYVVASGCKTLVPISEQCSRASAAEQQSNSWQYDQSCERVDRTAG